MSVGNQATSHAQRSRAREIRFAGPINKPRALRPNQVNFHVSIALLFAILILPTLLVILSYSYYANSKNLLSISQNYIDRARDESVSVATSLLDPVISTLRIIADVATLNQGFFRTEESRDLLYQALISADQIDAIYTSFEDGYHRVVTRIDADRRRSDPQIPTAANWHSSYIDSYSNVVSAGAKRIRHRTFFQTWPTVIAQYDSVISVDIRTLPHYVAAKQTHALAIADPSINPDTGYPVMSLGYPIIANNKFTGFVGANITFGILSRFLASHKISANSTTLIIDQSGQIIAHPDPAKGVRKVDGKIVIANICNLSDPALVKAAQERAAQKRDRVQFKLPSNGSEYVALFSPFPASFKKPWEVVIIARLDDFIGDLKRTSRNIAVLIVSLIGAEALLILFVTKKISEPIEAVASEMQTIQSLQFGQNRAPESIIREIYHLQRAVNLMSNSLRSFAAFVPVGIVRQLVDTGKPLALSGESRFLTVFFSDLEDFSSVSEHLRPEELTSQVSSYFEAVTGAVTQESGTIDKFIGDSVMAFWGAPTPVDDHVYRACVAALRAAHRMRLLNNQWMHEGRPQMRMRIGMHCADVVVGNVGSSDRLSYTVMGDGVNVASRLEGLNKNFRTTICISDSVYHAVAERIVARPIQLVSVKGRRSGFMVHELIGIRNVEDPEIQASKESIKLCALSASAVELLNSGRIAEATNKYKEILQEYPTDPVATKVLQDLVTEN